MDYFQPSAVDDATKPAAKANEEDRLRTASENSSDGNPFSFNASSMKPSAASHDLHSSDAVTGADHSSARSAARGPQTTQQEHPPTGGVSSSNGGSSNIGFREALMRRQGSSPSSFFAVAQTPGVMAHPLRASASSSGVDDAKTSSTSTSRWQKEMSSSSRSATHEGPAVGDSATHPPKLSGASPNWIGKSPRDSPAGRPSDAKGSTTTNGETSLTSSPFFNKPYDTPSSMAASTLHRSATNFTDAGRIESPRDIEERNSTTSAFQRRPPPKTLSSSSSTSTVTPKTTREGASQAGSSPPAANPAFSSSSTDTTVKTSSSTSPIEAPPPTKSSQMQQITSSSTSNSSPTKQHSCPLPSLRLPFMGGGGAAGKLPSGACASLPSKMSSFGARTGISRAFGGGAGSRKGPDIVQNPKFKTVTVGRELRDMLQGNHTASLKGDHSPSRSVRNAEVLILDLRPHTAFVAQGRLRHSVNICVPSTLLRRPNFALDKIAETISSRRDQSHFNRILNCAGDSDKGKGTRVILLDQETLLLSQDSMIHSLMSKIDKAGYEGEIAWVKGGWNAIQNFVEEGSASSGEEADLSAAVDMDILNEEDDEEEDEEMLEQRDGEIEEESESADDLAGSENSDIQDTRTPRQPFPSAVAGNGTFESASNGAGGAYFQNYLQGSRNIAGKGRSSQSSFTSTASSDSLFPSSVASSQSSMGSAMDRGNSTSPVTPHFDSSKLQLPQLRPSTSPAHSISSSSSAASFPAVKSRTLLSASTSGTASSSSSKTRSTSAGGGCSIVKPKNLPMAAFQYNSTAQAASGESPQKSLAGSGRPATSTGKGQFQMGLDNDNANIGRMPGSSGMEKSKSATRAPFGRKTAANPFFDNIRQNIEVSSLHLMNFEIPS